MSIEQDRKLLERAGVDPVDIENRYPLEETKELAQAISKSAAKFNLQYTINTLAGFVLGMAQRDQKNSSQLNRIGGALGKAADMAGAGKLK